MAELHGMYLNGVQAIEGNASPNDATTCPLTHPWSLTWNLKSSPGKLLHTIIFRFHVKLWRCTTPDVGTTMHQVTCLNRSSTIFFPKKNTNVPLKNCDVFTPHWKLCWRTHCFFPPSWGTKQPNLCKAWWFLKLQLRLLAGIQAPDEDEDFLGWVGWKLTEFGFGGVYAPPPTPKTHDTGTQSHEGRSWISSVICQVPAPLAFGGNM